MTPSWIRCCELFPTARRDVTYVRPFNAVLKSARRDVQVLLYYPTYDLWTRCLPVAGPFKEAVGSIYWNERFGP